VRTAFINQLVKEAAVNKRIFLLVGDLCYSVVEPFAEKFPDRFLNAGIAEQNMTGIAAGLAKEGYNVFTYSIGNFPTLRCMEQIRYDVCYHNLSVKIVAVGAGYAYGPLGTSHHTTEDIAMLRSIPGITVCSPASSEGPAYLRLGKSGERVLHNEHLKLPALPYAMLELKTGTGTAVLATGNILSTAVKSIEEKQVDWGLYSVPFIKPLDVHSLAAIANRYSQIITLEEHQKSAGFGSAILEALHDLKEQEVISNIPFVKRIAIPDIFIGYAGTQDYLREKTGLLL
jgi:transketolase